MPHSCFVCVGLGGVSRRWVGGGGDKGAREWERGREG